MSDSPHPLRHIPLADGSDIRVEHHPTFIALVIDDADQRARWWDGPPSFYLPTRASLGLAELEELQRQLTAAIKVLRGQGFRTQGVEGVRRRATELRNGGP